MDKITALAAERFGIHTIRPFQYLVMKRILEEDQRSDPHPGMIVSLPTGSGKSLCFMLPTLLVSGITIIVYPLLALMADQQRRFEEAHIPSLIIQGGQTPQERETLFSSLSNTRVIITNAETLSSNKVLAHLLGLDIAMIVVDEAHTIQRWGSTFRPALRTLGPLIAHLKPKQILCFTATADQEVINELNFLFFPHQKAHLIQGSSDRPNISYFAYPTLSKSRALATLLANQSNRPAIVFTPTRKLTETLARYGRISHPEIETRAYHAGLSNEERAEIEKWFLSHPDGILYATNAYGMGMDKKNIRTVIHHTLPSDILAFLQESGRAGRDGLKAHSIVLLNGLEPTTPLTTIFTQRKNCYRSLLLAHLNEEIESCPGCGVCLGIHQRRKEGERAIIKTLFFHPLSYSPFTLALILHKRDFHHRYSGVLAGWRIREIEEAISVLIATKKLHSPKMFAHKLIILPKIDKLFRGR